MNNGNTRIRELDGIRGLAILMVVLWHYVGCQVSGTGFVSRMLGHSTSLLWSGVDMFFVLSGFLIGGILLKSKNSKHYFKTFYIRRITRIFPLCYLLIFLYLLFVFAGIEGNFPWLTESLMPLWSYAAFTQNYFMGELGTYGGNWFAITWSLAIEEQFYLLLPLVIYLVTDKRLPLMLIAAILLAPCLRFAIHNFHSSVSLFCRMDSLLMGVLLAFAYATEKYNKWIMLNKNKMYALFGLLLSGFFLMHFKRLGPLTGTWLAFTYAFLILIAVFFKENRISAFLRNQWLGRLGTISYGVYIFHQLVSGLLHQLILNQSPQITSFYAFLVTVLSFVITIIISVLSSHYYETPILKLGHKFKYD